MDNRIQILVCDDDDISLGINKAYVEVFSRRYRKNVCIHEFLGINEKLKKLIAGGKIDIAFLDIDLADGIEQENGIYIARELQKKNKDIPIIFITSHGEYKSVACDILAVGYIPKPIIQEKFGLLYKRAFIQAEENRKDEKEKFISVIINRTETSILLSDIVSIEKIQRKLLIKSKSETWEAAGTMHSMEQMLPDYFLRISQSVIINTREVAKADRKNIRLTTGEVFYIGITYAKRVSDTVIVF